MADRNVVIKSIENCLHNKDCEDCCYEGCIHAHGNCIGDLMAHALELLREQPEQKFFVDSDGKITPLPIRKHGHWIPVKQPTGVEAFGYKELTAQEVTCSECGFTEDVMASAYLYCPECGAKMDEKVKQDD